MGGTAEEIERRVRAGEWPTPGDAAILLDVGRKTVDRMLTAGRIRYRVKPATLHRECRPGLRPARASPAAHSPRRRIRERPLTLPM
jgi:hypothetical protein